MNLMYQTLFIRNNSDNKLVSRVISSSEEKITPLGFGLYGKNYDINNYTETEEVKTKEDLKPQPVLVKESQTKEVKQLNTAELNRLLNTNYTSKLFDNKIAELKKRISSLNNKNFKEDIDIVYTVDEVKHAGGTQFTYKVNKHIGKLNIEAKIERANEADKGTNELQSLIKKEVSGQLDMFDEETFSTADETIMQTEEFKDFNNKNPKSSLKENLEYYKKCK